jgi:hypothetical protein
MAESASDTKLLLGFLFFVVLMIRRSSCILLKSFKEAVNLPQKQKWIEVMTEEYKVLLRSNTFTLVPLPEGRKPIKTKWIYKIKYNSNGSIERFKARWVARGFTQKKGIDFDETYAPVVRLENLRLLLAYATQNNLEADQVDIDSAFLQAKLTEEIYVTQPEGFISKEFPNHVCRLNKSLYGLKQAPLLWNQTLDKLFKTEGFIPFITILTTLLLLFFKQ